MDKYKHYKFWCIFAVWFL